MDTWTGMTNFEKLWSIGDNKQYHLVSRKKLFFLFFFSLIDTGCVCFQLLRPLRKSATFVPWIPNTQITSTINYRTFIQGRCNVQLWKLGPIFRTKLVKQLQAGTRVGLSVAQKLLVGTKVERFMASCRSKLLLLLLSTEYASAASQKMVAAPENLLLGLK